MSDKKDELITASELARRLDVNPSYIGNKKKKLIENKCTYGNKFYYKKCCIFLGKDPNDPHKSRQSELQESIVETKKPKPQKPPKEKPTETEIEDWGDENQEDDAKSLLEQIIKITKGKSNSTNRLELDILRQKAGVLREYFTAKNEEIKNRKLEQNLFEKDEVIQILSFAMNMIRNSIINLPNNYAVSLEGLNQKEIKDFVQEDTNRILEDLQKVGEQFE